MNRGASGDQVTMFRDTEAQQRSIIVWQAVMHTWRCSSIAFSDSMKVAPSWLDMRALADAYTVGK
jgi:hypothetical protein